jgi:SAM-dependent methyltransferase
MSDQPRPRSAAEFDDAYDGTPPWNIDRPQPALAAVAEAGGWHGRVLDVGCGTGEHALLAAARGLDATGVDQSPKAIERARRKAADRGLDVRFVVGDALDLPALQTRYDTIVDCGLFHVFEDDDRRRYIESVTATTDAGASFVMLCFSDSEPSGWGPRRISRDEIATSLAGGWEIESIEPASLETVIRPEPVRAWVTRARRV